MGGLNLFNQLNRKLELLELDKVNLIVFFIGVISVLLGVFIKDDEVISWLSLKGSDLKTVIISIGCSMIASSLVSYFSARYLIRRKQIKDIISSWGLEGIYRTRAEMNVSCNQHLTDMENNLDVIVFGMRSFRDSQGVLIANKVRKNLKVRILTLNPTSIFAKQREKDEGVAEGQLVREIKSLEKWVTELKKIAPDSKNVQIKFYDTTPQHSYLRQDGYVYIGPHLFGLTSQQTISYEFRENSQGYNYYSEYFLKLWEDEDFSKENY